MIFSEAVKCPIGYVLGGINEDAECPGTGLCCGAGWADACGEACAKKHCEEVGGTWIAPGWQMDGTWISDYNSRPFTCEVGKNIMN